MKHLLILLSAIFFYSCNSGNNDTSQADTLTDTSVDTISAAAIPFSNDSICYVFVSGKDVYTYRLLVQDNQVTGTAHYDNFEKDDSKGTVHGTIQNDIIHVWYNFESEGLKSVSERYFKVTENTITEGIGMIDVKGDSTYFSSPEKIDYTEGLVYKKTDC